MQPTERIIGCPSCGAVAGIKIVILDPDAEDPVAAWERQRVPGRPTIMKALYEGPSELDEAIARLLAPSRSGSGPAQ